MAAAGTIRKGIRNSVKNLLEAKAGFLGTVQVGKHYLPDISELPLTRIMTPVTERIKDNADATDLFIDLELEHWAGETDAASVDDLLDTMADLGEEVILDTTETLGGLVFRVVAGPQAMAVDDSSENILGALTASYTLHVIR